MKKFCAILLTVSLLLTCFMPTALAAAPGDVDADGTVTAADARLALRRAVGLESYAAGSAAFAAADIDADGTVTAADARVILRVAVGLEESWQYTPAAAADTAFLKKQLADTLAPRYGVSALAEGLAVPFDSPSTNPLAIYPKTPSEMKGLLSAEITDLDGDGKPELLTLRLEKRDSETWLVAELHTRGQGGVLKTAPVYDGKTLGGRRDVDRLILLPVFGKQYLLFLSDSPADGAYSFHTDAACTLIGFVDGHIGILHPASFGMFKAGISHASLDGEFADEWMDGTDPIPVLQKIEKTLWSYGVKPDRSQVTFSVFAPGAKELARAGLTYLHADDYSYPKYQDENGSEFYYEMNHLSLTLNDGGSLLTHPTVYRDGGDTNLEATDTDFVRLHDFLWRLSDRLIEQSDDLWKSSRYTFSFHPKKAPINPLNAMFLFHYCDLYSCFFNFDETRIPHTNPMYSQSDMRYEIRYDISKLNWIAEKALNLPKITDADIRAFNAAYSDELVHKIGDQLYTGTIDLGLREGRLDTRAIKSECLSDGSYRFTVEFRFISWGSITTWEGTGTLIAALRQEHGLRYWSVRDYDADFSRGQEIYE